MMTKNCNLGQVGPKWFNRSSRARCQKGEKKKNAKNSPCAPTTLAPHHRAGFPPLRRRTVAPRKGSRTELAGPASKRSARRLRPRARSRPARPPPPQKNNRLVAGERHEEFPGGRRPQRLPRPLRRCLQQPGAPRPDAVGEAGAGGRFPQRVAGAGRVPGSRRGAQGAAFQVEGGADHEDPALGARLQLLWLQAYNRVPQAMRYR